MSRVIVAVSGSGRTLENLLATQDEYAYEVAGVIASRPDCRGCEIARAHRLPLLIHQFPAQPDEVTSQVVWSFVDEHGAEFVALAGFLRRFPMRSGWERRIVNIHPALLPKYGGRGMYGDRVHAAVLAAGESESGATMHFVNEEYDEGQIIAQARVPVEQGDSVATLAARVFTAETELYPRALDRVVREAACP